MIIPIAIVLVVITIKLIYDYNLWLSHKPVNHKLEWVYMAIACIPSIILFARQSTLPFWVGCFVSALMIADFIWFFFNGIYNKLRGYGWWFTGSGGKDGAITDKFLMGLKDWQQKLFEVVPLISLITIYIIYLKQ